jgi:hypothetical protein
MRILVEEVDTAPIYRRITIALARAFRALGHEVIYLNTSGASQDTYASTLNDASIDYYLITNDSHFVYEHTRRGTFIFEEIHAVKLFIHHDSNIISSARDSSETSRPDLKIAALQRCANTSVHFCIELSTVQLLKKLGIKNTFEFFHASEFSRQTAAVAPENMFGISFVGHLMSSFSQYPLEDIDLSHHMRSLAYQRLARSSADLQPELERLSRCQIIQEAVFNNRLSPVAIFQHLLHELTKLTMPYRGELLSFIAKHQSIDIFGGDLSYGTVNHPLLKIDHGNVRYHTATRDYQSTQNIYSASTVNINISSLQFDSAINNRIIDVLFSGGFLITDRRSQIARLIPELQEFTFDTPEQMVAMAAKFHEASSSKLRKDFVEFVVEKYSKILSYEAAVDFILGVAKEVLVGNGVFREPKLRSTGNHPLG